MSVDTTFLVAAPRHREADTGTWLLRGFACATVGLAPLEGYLIDVQGQLAKLAPVLLGLTWIVVRARQRRLPRAHPVHAVLALFAVVLLASAAAHSAGEFTVDYTLRWLPFLMITVVLIDVAATEVPIRALLIAAVTGATVAGSGALYSLVVEGETRASGPLADPNDLAYFLMAALPLLLAVTPARAAERRPWPVVLATVAGVVLVAGAAATFSRGGALALIAAVGWLVVRRVLPMRVLAMAFGALAALGLAAVVLAGPELTKAFQEKSYIAGTNVDTRELRWQAAARMLTENPALGVGPGGFRSGYAAASHNAEIDEQTPVAHNMYLEVAAELGIGGFALFLGILATAAVASERTSRVSEDRREMVAVQASLLAVVVASTFLSEQYYLPLWSMVALACAAEVRCQKDFRRESGDARPARDQ